MVLDDSDDLVAGSGSLPSGVFSLAKSLLSGFLSPPDRLREAQTRLAELELAERLARHAPKVYRQTDFFDHVAERCDIVINGPRGSGKTAVAVALSQAAAQARNVKLVGVDIPEEAARSLGFESKSWATAQYEHDAVLLLDEFRIRRPEKHSLWSVLALARQRNLTVVYTSQSTAAVTPDVFRLGPKLLFTGADPVAAAFEREELQEIVGVAAQLLATQPTMHWPAAIYESGIWSVFDRPLPLGWSEDVSKLWA